MIVQLQHSEISFIYAIASLRYHEMLLNDANKSNKKFTDKSFIDIIIDGTLSEYAYCKHYNLFFNIADLYQYDIMHKKSRIDIKSTRLKNGKLVTPIKDYNHVDYFVLAIVSDSCITFVGYIETAEFIKPDNIRELIKGKPCYCLEQNQLNKLQ